MKGLLMKKIQFFDALNPEGTLPKPKPANEYIPDWYRNAKSYLTPDGKKAPLLEGGPSATVKRCMPLWDMMTAGYIIETPTDIYVRQQIDGPYFQWSARNGMAFQPIEQAQNHPWFEGISYAARIINPWSIKTPKDWSVMITNPTHRDTSPIEILPGIVDTDTYSLPSNIFVKLTDSTFEGLIPAGTPLAQIIPFKREAWVSELGGENHKKKFLQDDSKFITIFFDRYKKFWWQRKEYK